MQPRISYPCVVVIDGQEHAALITAVHSSTMIDAVAFQANGGSPHYPTSIPRRNLNEPGADFCWYECGGEPQQEWLEKVASAKAIVEEKTGVLDNRGLAGVGSPAGNALDTGVSTAPMPDDPAPTAPAVEDEPRPIG